MRDEVDANSSPMTKKYGAVSAEPAATISHSNTTAVSYKAPPAKEPALQHAQTV